MEVVRYASCLSCLFEFGPDQLMINATNLCSLYIIEGPLCSLYMHSAFDAWMKPRDLCP
jgi:hypothetical protein